MTGARFHLSNFSSRPRRPRWLSCCQGEESRRNGRNKRDETRGGARAVTCIAALLRVILLLSPPPSFSSHTIANGALTPRSNRRDLFNDVQLTNHSRPLFRIAFYSPDYCQPTTPKASDREEEYLPFVAIRLFH